MIRIDERICRDLASASIREWLETNGIGGYASSTITGLNTRRYHGLLIAATQPPLGRMVLLSKLEETLVIEDKRLELSTNRYPGVVHPHGYRFLKEFRLDPFPVFLYQAEGIEIEKRVFLAHGENTAVIEYESHSGECVLEIRPLIAFRDYHAITHRNDALNPAVGLETGLASITPYPELPTLYFAHNAIELEGTGVWYYHFEYDAERERGFEDSEDLFNPFMARFELARSTSATIIASTLRRAAEDAPKLRQSELNRRAALVAAAPPSDELAVALSAAADQFIVRRDQLHSVIAGYHWFSDWGRDAMIALPGLALETGRADIARDVLLAFARHVDRGMLPNRFPEPGEMPEYNTVDAALWMFEAVRAYLARTADMEFARQIFPILAGIIDCYRKGTRYGIQLDADGLVRAGAAGVQLTWMDAKMGDQVVTPRQGKPVEIQALWYNALCVMEGWQPNPSYAAMAQQTRASFNREFWNEQQGCLYDVIDGEVRDASLRPNQILAVSLPHSMLCPERARRVVEIVEQRLLTPFGLRTLPQDDARYHGHYEGDARNRDMAYHQGTVWPWLMGPFITAWMRVHEPSETNLARIQAWFRNFEQHLTEAGLGQISEIFDGDSPHTPRGCIAQAWSVGELLRVYALLKSSGT